MPELTYWIDRDEATRSPWVATFTYGALSHFVAVPGTRYGALGFAHFAARTFDPAISGTSREAFAQHFEGSFGSWVRQRQKREAPPERG
jgi:hypothetical protein